MEMNNFYEKVEHSYKVAKDLACLRGSMEFSIYIVIYASMLGLMYISGILHERGDITIGEITTYLFTMFTVAGRLSSTTESLIRLAGLSGQAEKMVDYTNVKPLVNTEGGIIPTQDSMTTIGSIAG